MAENLPRTVLYLTPSARLLGARRSLLTLATNLDPARWKPVVCGQSHGDLEDALTEKGIPYKILKMGWWRKGKYFLWRPFAIAQLASLIRRVGADVVHCNEIYPNPFAVRACSYARDKVRGCPPVMTHMRLTVTPRMIRNYDLRRAHRIIVPSVAAGRDFDIWPDKDERVEVVHNGVDLSEFRRSRSSAEARRTIGIPPEGLLFGALGQLGPRKGGDTILDAFKELHNTHPESKLMFVGNPHKGQEEFADALRRRAESEPQLKGRVFFIPFTQHILPYYEAMDVNLLISREEGFGRTIIEAGSMGAPSIGTKIGGIPELIVHEKTGLLIEGEDAPALTEGMKRMIEDMAMRSAMNDAVFMHMAQNFSITSHVEKIMDIYDGAVAPV